MQLILVLCICLVSVIIFSIVGGLITITVFDFNITGFNNYGDPKVIDGLKLFQLFSAFGLFLVPPIVYSLLTSNQPFKDLGFRGIKKPINYLLVIFLMILSTPFVSWVIELNSTMILPDFMSGVEQWMRETENRAEELTQAFLTFNGPFSLFYTLIIVAIIPALGEELLFRGILQKIFIGWTKNAHLGIWITAILFSALHMQFFGFFPRLLLGVMFGYIYLWTRSLWLPVLGHFINNASVVIISYFFPDNVKNADIAFFNETEFDFIFYLLSFLVSVALFVIIKKINQQEIVDEETSEVTSKV